MPYSIIFLPGWDRHFSKMDKSVQDVIWKKIQKQKEETPARHLQHGVEFFVAEAGQYRIVLKINELEKSKAVHFAGSHKQYEKWLKEFK